MTLLLKKRQDRPENWWKRGPVGLKNASGVDLFCRRKKVKINTHERVLALPDESWLMEDYKRE